MTADNEQVVGGEHTLLGYLHQLGVDNGADFDYGVNGYFSWEVDGDVMTVTWVPYYYEADTDNYQPSWPHEQKWRLVPV